MRVWKPGLLSGLFGLVCCCGQPPVGYRGPLPSVVARQSLTALWGCKLAAGSVAFTTSEVELIAFVVGPHGPTVSGVELGAPAGTEAKRHWIPVLTDGDIADLHLRATGSVPAGLAGDLSEGYRKLLTGR